MNILGVILGLIVAAIVLLIVSRLNLGLKVSSFSSAIIAAAPAAMASGFGPAPSWPSITSSAVPSNPSRVRRRPSCTSITPPARPSAIPCST